MRPASFRRRVAGPLLTCAVSALVSCGPVTAPGDLRFQAPSDVLAFVRSQGLPDLHAVQPLFSVTESDGVVFMAEYGKPNDCQAGCFYSRGYGMRFADRIGWLRVYDYDGIDTAALRHFDVEAGDTDLFTDAAWARIAGADPGSWFLWAVYLPVLASDADTPAEALHRMAALLSGWISPHVARLLLDRAVADGDTGLLQTLACLPVFQGDAYEYVRQAARDALGDAFTPCGE